MILNGKTSTHDIYLPKRRAKKKPQRQANGALAGDPKGSLAEKCAWMRSRQARSKGANRQ